MARHLELVVRAWDGADETQPSSTAEIWNYPGRPPRPPLA
jgi:hypothetical protein